jgi:hypothetical protein
MPANIGAAVNFGFTGTDGIAEATILTGKIILQSASFSNTSDMLEVLDADGDAAAVVFSNPGFSAELEYIPTGASIALARTNTAIPAHGAAIIDITACASLPALDKTNWFVVGEPRITHSNTGVARITLSLKSYAGITAVATAG